MKVKLLKKVRKQYQIYYRERQYGLREDNHYKLESRHFFQTSIDEIFATWFCETLAEAKEIIVEDLRQRFPKLGYYNRQRAIKETEYKVWYK